MGNAFDAGIGVSPVAPVGMGNARSLDNAIPQNPSINDVLYS
jgi:hypothetical protein